MLKKSVLTPVLSGVLAVTVVGSGVGYYNVFVKDKGADTEEVKKSAKNGKTAVLTVDEAAKTLGTTLEKAQEVAKGTTDTGYKATVGYSAPSDGEIGQLGLKDIAVSAEAKQKDKMTGLDYIISYDSSDVLPLNVVYDNDSQTAYIKIPELSDAYLTGTVDQINEMMGSSLDSYTSMAGMDNPLSGDADLSALENYDFAALMEDLLSYADTVKENVPEAKDGENYTVEKDGVSIELTTKSYTVTTEDAKKVADAVIAKGKADSTLKDLFTQMGVSDSDYESIWDELDMSDAEDETVNIDVYYKVGNVAGFKAVNSDGEEMRCIAASDEKNVIIDCDLSSVEDSTFVMSGLVTYENDTLDGSINVDAADMNMVINYNSVKVTEDSANGTMTISASQGGEAVMDMSCTLDVSGNQGTITYTGSAEGQSIGTITVKVEETNASDISVPTGTMYNFTNEEELRKYADGCDVEGWQNKLKTALGDELFNQIFGSSMSSGSSYGASSDFDASDYDFDDYDFGDIELQTTA